MPPLGVPYTSCETFVRHLLNAVIADARGDHLRVLDVRPSGRFWLGRLAPEAAVRRNPLGERGERLDPCEVGICLRPSSPPLTTVTCNVSVTGWARDRGANGTQWRKTGPLSVQVPVAVPTAVGDRHATGRVDFEHAFEAAGLGGLSAEIHSEVSLGRQGSELTVTVVNTSPEELEEGRIDSNLYEVRLQLTYPGAQPFVLEALPASFRYDRRITAYGINGGVEVTAQGVLSTTDFVLATQPRPEYWDSATCGAMPSLRPADLAADPLPSLRALIEAYRRWVAQHWGDVTLRQRSVAEQWSTEMAAEANAGAADAEAEIRRLEDGLRLLETQPDLRRAFGLMNRAFSLGRLEQWRPFQLGFILAGLSSVHAATATAEADIVETLWFPTGGGKTETYLGLLVTQAFYDRMRGKLEGISGWARFPLRMLSLQQTQRFAEALCAAELVRQQEDLAGEPFSLGFLVGESSTPNDIPIEPRPYDPNPDDPEMPGRYQVLLACPFCGSERIQMNFDRASWTLEHRCVNTECAWPGPALPVHVVDKEIYRFLPTVVVGTIDKVANVAMQAAMRGFYGAPLGKCSVRGHGFTYAPRSKAPTGCLYPGCQAGTQPLGQETGLYAPALRLQDEIHLLRDSLGAIDSHYESLLDHLQGHTGARAKIAASSATLAGHHEQVETLYRRRARVFPCLGPRAHHSFWSVDSQRLARLYVALAPRGVTLEFAADRTNEILQQQVRAALSDPVDTARRLGLPAADIDALASLYGVQVTYGSTLRDVEAAARSFQTELRVSPVIAATLTSRTPLEEVREVLRRLKQPERDFGSRIHLIAASSMLSHGVDVDRLNVMLVLGLPLSTAEFIQTTSRIGRAAPGLVLVLHKMARERDAAVYRSFSAFVQNADRLVDPIPITRRSRKVLALTLPGLFMARVYGVHEPANLAAAGGGALTTVRTLRRAIQRMPILEEQESRQLIDLLGFAGPLDEHARQDIRAMLRDVFRALNDPATVATFPTDVLPSRPMLSLRDVEAEVPVYSRGGE